MDTQVTAIMTTITQIRIQYSVLCNLEYDTKTRRITTTGSEEGIGSRSYTPPICIRRHPKLLIWIAKQFLRYILCHKGCIYLMSLNLSDFSLFRILQANKDRRREQELLCVEILNCATIITCTWVPTWVMWYLVRVFHRCNLRQTLVRQSARCNVYDSHLTR